LPSKFGKGLKKKRKKKRVGFVALSPKSESRDLGRFLPVLEVKPP